MVYKAEVQQKANKLENVRVQVIDSNGKTISDNLDEKNAGLLQDMHNIIWKD